MAQSVWQIISSAVSDHAIGAPGRPWLGSLALRELTGDTLAGLNRIGIGRADRVAMVLPNGPEMATGFLAISAAATAAPLNPAYKTEELLFSLTDLRPKAVVVQAGDTGPAASVAAQIGVPVILLESAPDGPAGLFRLDLTGFPDAEPAAAGPGKADEPALVLHTSGTTARPKIVVLSNGNIAASAHHIAASLALTERDVCLNIMPLFHIHGLIAAVLASLSAGAAVCCTPGFNAFKFFDWLTEVKPSWYTAVPTMHQAILMRAKSNAEAIAAAPLRFIRSSSASLPPRVMAQLEAVFAAPVIEAYGMTEASHQMAANPLPPRPRKPGSVGIAAGPEIAIMDADGTLLPQGAIGEVVIRGPNVTAGYDGNPEANARAFTAGWFRTGDQGRLDAEGYLFLTGRLKELINRGGEKVSPLEIDAVLMDHPAVAQCVTFAIPHDKLGEEVGAVVVLAEGAEATEQDIRAFAAARLAAFKVPRRVLFLNELPKGATGKLQRIGLAEKLGL